MRAVLPNLSNSSLQYQLCKHDEIHYLYAFLYYIPIKYVLLVMKFQKRPDMRKLL